MPTTLPFARLLLPHHRELLIRSGIADNVITARGYFSEDVKANLARLGFSASQRQTPALVIPLWSLDGQIILYQIRPDAPRIHAGKPRKYEVPFRSHLIIDVPPAAREKVNNPREPLFLTEGVRKADAAVTKGLCCLGLMSVWGWKNQERFWDKVPLTGRSVFIAFDSDFSINRSVRSAGIHLQQFLKARQAEVQFLFLPAAPNGDKVGLDDYLANHDAEELLQLVSPTIPYEPEPSEKLEDRVMYHCTDEGLVVEKHLKEGTVPEKLTNFGARIIAQTLVSDGVDESRELEIEAKVNGAIKLVTVAADRFDMMGWVTPLLGADAIVYAGYGTRDHARVAIQQVSGAIPTKHLYSHLGWLRHEGRWVFLHAAGIIGADSGAEAGQPSTPDSNRNSTDNNGLQASGPMGPIPAEERGILPIGTRLPGSLSRYILPEPPPKPLLRRAILASLGLLDIGPDDVVLPLFAAAWRAPLGDADFSLHLSGQTGVGKSELAALIAQHFGAGLDARHLPGAWSSTANNLEATAFLAKDVVFPVDDWVPKGSQSDVERVQRDADRLFRAQGNHSGRGRCNRDGTPKEGKPPRCLILSTGEDIPEGQSLQARLLIVEMKKGQIKWSKVTECQRDTANGLYAEAMAGYIQWLAGHFDPVRSDFRFRRDHHRDELQAHKAHPRLVSTAADLLASFEVYLQFIEEQGVLGEADTNALFERLGKVLIRNIKAQRRDQASSSPVSRFLSLLRTLFLTGRAHVADTAGGPPEEKSHQWGWEEVTTETEGGPQTVRHRRGPQIGWIAGTRLMLDGKACLAEVKRLADGCNKPLDLSEKTLGKLLLEKGLLTERNKGRYTIKRRILGSQHRVLELHADKVLQQPDMGGDRVTQEELSRLLLPQ
ncbi:MAG: DUF3854 domain-containing protein [Gemmataceae bacterium]